MSVVAFNGGPIPGEPVADVVERLETLLERAKAGEVVAIAFALLRPDGLVTTGWEVPDGERLRMAPGVMILAHRYGAALAGGDGE